MMIKQPALAPSPQPRPAPTVQALPAELAVQRGPFWMPIRGPNPTPIDKQLVETGPDPATDGVVRWRCVDLKRVLGLRFGVDLSEVSLGRVLKKLGFSHISARPQHPVQDPEAIATFKKTFQRRSRRS